MSMSNYLESALIDHTLRNTAYTSPTTVYAALSTADPTEAGTGTVEPDGTWYARIAATFDAAGANSAIIDFGTVTADDNGDIVTHVAIYDAVTGGNMLYYGALTTSKTLNTDDDVTFPVGTLTITLD